MSSERRDERAVLDGGATASAAARPGVTLGLGTGRPEAGHNLPLPAARADDPAHAPRVLFDVHLTAQSSLEGSSPSHPIPRSQLSAVAGPSKQARQVSTSSPLRGDPAVARPEVSRGLRHRCPPRHRSRAAEGRVALRAARDLVGGSSGPRPPRPGDPADHRYDRRSTPLYAARFRPHLGSSNSRARARIAAGDSHTTPSPNGPACGDARTTSGSQPALAAAVLNTAVASSASRQPVR